MQIENPFVKGSIAFQNFNSTVLSNKHLTISLLQDYHAKLRVKADDFLNYSDHQRDCFDQESRAVEALIKQKEQV